MDKKQLEWFPSDQKLADMLAELGCKLSGFFLTVQDSFALDVINAYSDK